MTMIPEFLDNTPHNNSPVINSETSKHTDHDEEDSDRVFR